MASTLAQKTNYVSEGLALLTSEYQRPRPVALAVVPTVTAISPRTGPDAGGTAVTITGTGFTGATSGTLDGVALASIVVVSGTTITAVTSAGIARGAAGAVSVTTGAGSGSLSSGWEYVDMIIGTLAARPAASVAGRRYAATDTNQYFYDNGSAWVEERPFPQEQESTHAMASATDTLSAAEQLVGILVVTNGTGADATITYAAATAGTSRMRSIFNSSSYNLYVTNGGSAVFEIGPNLTHVLVFDANGVRPAQYGV